MSNEINSEILYDFAVVGGGPTGSQIAYKLSENGHRVVVLEKKDHLNKPVCCTGIVSRECVETYSIPDSVIYRSSSGARLYSPGGRVIHVKRNTPQVSILNRSALNQLWALRAQTKGAEYIMSAEVRNLRAGKQNSVLNVYIDGSSVNLKAKAVVVTTGFGSHMVETLGLGAAGDFVMGVQVEVETKFIEDVEVFFGSKIAPAFFAWLVPTLPGKALVGLLSRRHPPAYLRTLLERLATEGKIVFKDAPFTFGGVPLKPLPRTYDNRLLVVGTSAGQVKPLTGGGIYFGLLCADIAADTLHEAIVKNDFSADKLSIYERRWKKKLLRELRFGYLARRFYEVMSDSQFERIFTMMKTSGLVDELQAAEELSFDWHAGVISHIFNERLFKKALGALKLPFGLKPRTTTGT